MPRLRARRLTRLLLILAGAPLALHAWADTSPPDDPLRVHAARRLDDEGKLSEALPLYAVRARQTVTQADRLRYAAALLRAGRSAEARAVFDQLVGEEGSMEDGDGARCTPPPSVRPRRSRLAFRPSRWTTRARRSTATRATPARACSWSKRSQRRATRPAPVRSCAT